MKRLLQFLLVSMLPLYLYGQDCVVTWDTGDGMTMNAVMQPFTFINNGDKVPKGSTVVFMPSCNAGYQYDSFKANGKELRNESYDQMYTDRDYQVAYTVNEDTHIVLGSSIRSFLYLDNIRGNGELIMTYNGKALKSGDKVPYGTTLSLTAKPAEGETVTRFTINDDDYLSTLQLGSNRLELTTTGTLTIKITFSGEDKPENMKYPVIWDAIGDGSVSVETTEGTSLSSGDLVDRGTEIIIIASPNNDSELKRVGINDRNMTRKFLDNGTYTTTVNILTEIQAGFTIIEPTEPTESGVWIDKAADSYAGGSGTEADPYLIESAEQLAKLAKDVANEVSTKGLYFQMNNDIDFAGNTWHPIGYRANPSSGKASPGFEGNFDGKNFIIKNIETKQIPDIISYGLFGFTTEKAEIRNIIIGSGSFNNEMIVGAIVGYNGGLIEGCTNYANVLCDMMYCGGITGSNSASIGFSGVIRNCVNYGEITAGTGSNGLGAGGISASNSNLIEGCANYGTITAKTASAGGIAGVFENGTIKNCYNRGRIISPEQTGGIAGSIYGREGNCEIESSYSAAPLEGTSITGGVWGGAIFINENVFSVKAVFYDTDLFYGDLGGDTSVVTFNTDEISGGLTTDNMLHEDFVELLNSGTPDKKVWYYDTENKNSGYPVLGETQISGISTPATSDSGITISTKGNNIVINGCGAAEPAAVYNTAGMVVFKGTAGALSRAKLASGMYIVKVLNTTQKVYIR